MPVMPVLDTGIHVDGRAWASFRSDAAYRAHGDGWVGHAPSPKCSISLNSDEIGSNFKQNQPIDSKRLFSILFKTDENRLSTPGWLTFFIMLRPLGYPPPAEEMARLILSSTQRVSKEGLGAMTSWMASVGHAPLELFVGPRIPRGTHGASTPIHHGKERWWEYRNKIKIVKS